jgi:hypothetical protein
MECKHNTADGCKAYPHRTECIGKVCECFVPEEDYQAYIDELHKQIETLYETITEQANKLDEYEQAMIDAFKKWSRI